MSDQPKNVKSGHGLWLSRAALGFVALAAVMGWGASFVGLHAYGQDQMVGFSYWTAWLIPATFDGAAFGATLITYRASIYGRSAVRGRLLMWTFTAISSWINWIHQLTPEARVVAAGLPVAAVAVFDVVLAELRADYEERHGKRRLRLRPGLLLLRWLVDRNGTAGAFRRQVTDIPVSEIAGLRSDHPEHADAHQTDPATTQAIEAANAVRHPEPAQAPALPAPQVTRTPVPQQPEPRVRTPEAPTRNRPEPQARESQMPVPQVPQALAEPEPKQTEAAPFPVEPDDQPEPGPAREEDGGTDRERAEPRDDVSSAEQTQTLPPVPADPLTDENKRTFARRDYRLSLEIGEPITGAQLGHRYGFSERWGRRQIAAVRVEMEQDEDRELVSVD